MNSFRFRGWNFNKSTKGFIVLSDFGSEAKAFVLAQDLASACEHLADEAVMNEDLSIGSFTVSYNALFKSAEDQSADKPCGLRVWGIPVKVLALLRGSGFDCAESEESLCSRMVRGVGTQLAFAF